MSPLCVVRQTKSGHVIAYESAASAMVCLKVAAGQCQSQTGGLVMSNLDLHTSFAISSGDWSKQCSSGKLCTNDKALTTKAPAISAWFKCYLGYFRLMWQTYLLVWVCEMWVIFLCDIMCILSATVIHTRSGSKWGHILVYEGLNICM